MILNFYLQAFEVNGEPLLEYPVKLDLAKGKKHTLPVSEMRGLSKRVRRLQQ
ncbi:hypothetical protein Hanom_Chr17g01581091 [Helianthus anomalus]